MEVRELVRVSAAWCQQQGMTSPRLEAELLLAHVLGVERLQLYLDGERPLVEAELGAYRELIRRRARGEPSAYLTGRREFYGLELRVTPDVLVPRPETEMLVDRVRELAPLTLLDIGTGSGCIAIACAVRLPACRVLATDCSAAALSVARENAERHGVADRIEFREGDLFGALPGPLSFDLIVSNPPYVSEGYPVSGHEPRGALFAGPKGLDVLRPLLAGARRYSERLLLEIGEEQEEAVRALAAPDWGEISVTRDLAGHPRMAEASATPLPRTPTLSPE